MSEWIQVEESSQIQANLELYGLQERQNPKYSLYLLLVIWETRSDFSREVRSKTLFMNFPKF